MKKKKQQSAKTSLLQSIQRAFAVSIESNKNKLRLNEVASSTTHIMDRRKFISNAAKATLIASVSGGAFLASCSKSQPTVVVIGAGIAGLSAAYALKKAGIMAQVFEASPRTGGRIFTASDIMGKGLTTELGGEFIDTAHADLFAYIKEFNLPLIDTQIASEKTMKHACYYFNGEYLSDTDIINLLEPFAMRIQNDIDALSENISYHSFSERDQQLDRLSISEYLSGLGITGTLFDLLDVAYTTEYGLDIAEQSAINFLVLINPGMKDSFNYSGDSDERYKIAGGNQLIPDAIAQRLPYQINVGHTLESIASKNSGKKVVINFRLAGGSSKEVTADYVIITIPFSILRDINIDYPFSNQKIKAIREMGYGKNAKLFIGFRSHFWREQQYAGFAFSDNGLQCGWDNSQLQSGAGAGYTVFTGGTASDALINGTDKEQALIMLQKMEMFFPGAAVQCSDLFSRFHWPTYTYAKASYTCYKPGQYTTLEGAQSEPAGNVYFAGEHCSYEFQGFMNGGAITGRLAAEAIIKGSQ